MALTALADKGNVLHIYDFRVKPGMEDEFIRLFEQFDYSDENPMHKSSAQVRDGVLCRDVSDPGRFFLIGEWKSIEEHKKILKIVKPVDAVLSEKHMPRFLIRHRADEASIRGGNRFVKGCAFWFVVENGDQRGCVDDDHRGKPKSS